MKTWRGNNYQTLTEWLSVAGHTLPAVLSSITIGTGANAISIADYIAAKFGGRYLCRSDADAWLASFTATAKATAPFVAEKITNLTALVADLVADEDVETMENKFGSNGTVSFSEAYADGGYKRTSTGASSGNADRIIAYQDNVRNIFEDYAKSFSVFFIGELDEWGDC